jgi:hypothetical protein
VTSQARELRALLKKHGITSRWSKRIHVRTKTIIRKGGYREWDYAWSIVRQITREEAAALIAENKYLEIHCMESANPSDGYTVIRSHGSEVTFSKWEMKK